MIPTTFHLLELTDKDFQTIREVLYEHCGINLTPEKKELVRSRLSSHVRRNNMRSYTEYIDMVLSNRNGQEFVTFINRLSTNLTSFFREPKHFDYFKSVFLPERLARKNTGPVRLRGWSAACSSGEEPYTLAMTLKESLPSGRTVDAKILASDISTAMLDKARGGRYPADRLNTVPVDLQRKYFKQGNDQGEKYFQVSPTLREMIIFKQINLIQPWPLTTKLDFIFCRNVLIYFDKETHRKLAERFYEILNPGGVLFIGHSESLSGIQHMFKSVAPAIYVKS
ncbi:MAG: protein-glutamate O-methyltransferase [Pontiellaceae bacterium]|nr:protein-glutamate O-methyltransferase [Pontiellaceae bacterium]MBN2785805.1 protein-glutamate O-methyltransferase [Pontiellaceae bacterium]